MEARKIIITGGATRIGSAIAEIDEKILKGTQKWSLKPPLPCELLIANQSSTLRTEVSGSKIKYHLPGETIAIKVFQADRGEEMKSDMNMEQQSRFDDIEICMAYGWTSKYCETVSPVRNELFQTTLFMPGFCRDGVFEQDMERADAAPAADGAARVHC